MRQWIGIGLIIACITAFRFDLIFAESSVIEVCLAHPWLHQWDCPYSIAWYGIVELIPHNTFQDWADSIAIIDAVIMLLVRRYLGLKWFSVYSAVSFSAFLTPYNMPIIWLTLLGFYSRKLLIIPVLVKLPLGSELYVSPWYREWDFVFHHPLQTPYAYVWYLVIGSWWLVVLFHHTFITSTENKVILPTGTKS